MRTSSRSPSSSSPADHSRRPTSARPASAGRRSRTHSARSAGPIEMALGAAYDRFSDLSAAVGDVLANAGHAPDPATSPSLVEVAATFAAIEAASGPGSEGRAPRRPARAGRSADRPGHRPRPLRRAAHRAPRGPGGGRAREGVRPAARRGEARGHAHRRRRPAPRRSPATGRLEGAALALFHPAQVHARVARGGRRRDHDPARPDGLGRGQVRRHPLPAPPRRARRSGCTRATCTTSPASFPEVVAAARDLPWAGILDGEILAWRDGTVLPFIALQSRLGRKDPSAAIRADVPVIFVAWDVLGLDEPRQATALPATASWHRRWSYR